MPRVPLHHPPSFRRHPLTVGRVACKQGTWLAEAALNASAFRSASCYTHTHTHTHTHTAHRPSTALASRRSAAFRVSTPSKNMALPLLGVRPFACAPFAASRILHPYNMRRLPMTHRFRFTCTRLLPACALAALLVGRPALRLRPTPLTLPTPAQTLTKAPSGISATAFFLRGASAIIRSPSTAAM